MDLWISFMDNYVEDMSMLVNIFFFSRWNGKNGENIVLLERI